MCSLRVLFHNLCRFGPLGHQPMRYPDLQRSLALLSVEPLDVPMARTNAQVTALADSRAALGVPGDPCSIAPFLCGRKTNNQFSIVQMNSASTKGRTEMAEVHSGLLQQAVHRRSACRGPILLSVL